MTGLFRIDRNRSILGGFAARRHLDQPGLEPGQHSIDSSLYSSKTS
jgi:hypothetical protein